MIDTVKNICDGLSVTTVIATLLGALPHVAALFTLIWTVLRVYETKTIQDWLQRRRDRRKKKKADEQQGS